MSTPQGSSEPTRWPSDHTAGIEIGKVSAPSQGHAQNDNLELSKMQGAEADVGLQGDIMQLARLGDVGGMRKLFDQGKFSPRYRDEEGITPLHVSPKLTIADGIMS